MLKGDISLCQIIGQCMNWLFKIGVGVTGASWWGGGGDRVRAGVRAMAMIMVLMMIYLINPIYTGGWGGGWGCSWSTPWLFDALK